MAAALDTIPLTRQRSNSVDSPKSIPVPKLDTSAPNFLRKDRRRRSLDARVLLKARKLSAVNTGISRQPKLLVHNLKSSGQELNSTPKKLLYSLKKGSESVNRAGAVHAKRVGRVFREAASKTVGSVVTVFARRRKTEPVFRQSGLEIGYAAPLTKKKSSESSVLLVHLLLLVAFCLLQVVMR